MIGFNTGDLCLAGTDCRRHRPLKGTDSDDAKVWSRETFHTTLALLHAGSLFNLIHIAGRHALTLTRNGEIRLASPLTQQPFHLQWQPVIRETGRLCVQLPGLAQCWLAAGHRTLPNSARRSVTLEFQPSRASLWSLHRTGGQSGLLLRSHYAGGHLIGVDKELSLAAGILPDAFWEIVTPNASTTGPS